MTNDLKLPKTYKTLLMLALVFGPFYWLAFTEDGQRRTDLGLMFVLGNPEFNAALDAFNSGLTEARLRELFPKLRFQCATGANPFGDRLCGAGIGSFNQIPASSVTLFFLGEQLRAAKVVYRRSYHRTVREWARQRLALRDNSVHPALENRQDSREVMAEAVDDGALFVRDGELARTDEPALLWLSQAAIDTRR
ncbi:hypothetical protein [Thiocystis violascens]|uniref:Uncharacterized protein n=1 Tax=Thiocystis violascens (strain ATCC 17096 / DSM 198 / 6111) TaxID=765911 RepID=I3YF18_THIV6|nr:hypothetical protein [Thiocystis violascens]AFL75586.1 hypothetical protein Thivi_3740 [Thiocystis violascens DSM 198]